MCRIPSCSGSTQSTWEEQRLGEGFQPWRAAELQAAQISQFSQSSEPQSCQIAENPVRQLRVAQLSRDLGPHSFSIGKVAPAAGAAMGSQENSASPRAREAGILPAWAFPVLHISLGHHKVPRSHCRAGARHDSHRESAARGRSRALPQGAPQDSSLTCRIQLPPSPACVLHN